MFVARLPRPEQDGNMRRAILTTVLVGALAVTGVATAAAFVLTTPSNSSTDLDIAPITSPKSGPDAPAQPTPTATPTHSSGGTVVVTPHESEDVGDDHGGNSGHGGGSDDGSSGHGGGGD
jgi:hypothetical protein